MSRLLIGCEFSGRVRDAFIKQGVEAVSCDLRPSESGLGEHYQGDIMDIIDDKWGGLIVFPDCTYLCGSGLHWNKRRPERAELTEKALDFVRMLLGVDIEHIALENPVGCISSRIRPPNQYIHPWEFGHDESKKTGLWLKNLPPLMATSLSAIREQKMWKLPPSPERAKLRSITYPGIAQAMSVQWSEYFK